MKTRRLRYTFSGKQVFVVLKNFFRGPLRNYPRAQQAERLTRAALGMGQNCG
jgi:hypothetical protein